MHIASGLLCKLLTAKPFTFHNLTQSKSKSFTPAAVKIQLHLQLLFRFVLQSTIPNTNYCTAEEAIFANDLERRSSLTFVHREDHINQIFGKKITMSNSIERRSSYPNIQSENYHNQIFREKIITGNDLERRIS